MLERVLELYIYFHGRLCSFQTLTIRFYPYSSFISPSPCRPSLNTRPTRKYPAVTYQGGSKVVFLGVAGLTYLDSLQSCTAVAFNLLLQRRWRSAKRSWP